MPRGSTHLARPCWAHDHDAVFTHLGCERGCPRKRLDLCVEEKAVEHSSGWEPSANIALHPRIFVVSPN